MPMPASGRLRRTLQRAGAVAVVALLVGTGSAVALSGGSDINDGGYTFLTKVQIGDSQRSCSGALVQPQLVLTAAACFAGTGDDAVIKDGAPLAPITAVIGRADVAAGTNGVLATVTRVTTHPDRDLALARLAKPVSGVAPIPLAKTAPKEGETLTLAGFGRTADTWVPDRAKYARFDVGSVGGASFEVTPAGSTPANICRGDAGGPAFRETGGTVELVAVHLDSNQAGCVGEPDGTPKATETRIDDLAEWVAGNRPGFTTGFESADARPNFFNTVNTRTGGGGSVNVSGVTTSVTVPEMKVLPFASAHGGSQALLYSGKDDNATKSYAFTTAYQFTNVSVSASSVLSYWIFPQSKEGYSKVEGSNSTCVAVDLLYSDGKNLRDSGATDQRGTKMHPASMCGRLTLDAWNEVVVPLGATAAGKKITTVSVGYDQAAKTGGYRGFIDDLKITDTVEAPLFATGVESGEPALAAVNTVATGTRRGGLKNVVGVCCSLTGPELKPLAAAVPRVGPQALLYSGKDNNATSSYAYTQGFLTDVYVKPTTRLSYWIYPQSPTSSSHAEGTNSRCVSVDLIVTDKFDATVTSLRDAAVADQTGHRVHPAYQCVSLTLDTWNYVTVPLGDYANGRQITEIDIGYDQAANTGGYRGFVDDIQITQ
jgi:trypsin